MRLNILNAKYLEFSNIVLTFAPTFKNMKETILNNTNLISLPSRARETALRDGLSTAPTELSTRFGLCVLTAK